jgi:hypothetical protein
MVSVLPPETFFTGQHEFGDGAQQAAEVDAAVAEKAVVLGGQQRLDKLPRNLS